MSGVLQTVAGRVDLVVTGAWSGDDVECLRDGRADGLVLNYALGFAEHDLRFLTGLPIRRLTLLARTHKDLSPIYSLAPTLTALDLQSDPREPIELNRLPKLRRLAACWSQVAASIGSANRLTDVFLLSYDEPDLRPLSQLPLLERLVLKDRPAVASLDGIEALPRLTELGVFAAGVLQDITALSRSPARPTIVRLGACPQVPDLEVVHSLTSVRTFEFSDGGEIPSIAPLAALSEVEALILYGGTNVADGDLTPLTRLPRLSGLRMRNRRHYRPSVSEIQASLAASR